MDGRPANCNRVQFELQNNPFVQLDPNHALPWTQSGANQTPQLPAGVREEWRLVQPGQRAPQGAKTRSAYYDEFVFYAHYDFFRGENFFPDPQNPAPQQPNQTVIGIVNAVFANPKCAEFLKTILNKASTKGNPVLHGGDIAKIFSDFLTQKKGGVTRGSLPGARYGSASGRVQSSGKGNGVIFRDTVAAGGDQDEYDASGIVNELPHLAGSEGGWPNRNEYDDLSLARATYNSGYDKYFRFFTVPNPFSTFADKKSQERNRYSNVWSSYFHDILKQHCPVP